MGIIQPTSTPVRSSQAIDLQKRIVRNVVTFSVPPRNTRATVTGTSSSLLDCLFFLANLIHCCLAVNVTFTPDSTDLRKINVKFQSCRVKLQDSPLDVTIPLGIVGPTGWLRTSYIDESMRITRGHKGSIFILTRPSKLP